MLSLFHLWDILNMIKKVKKTNYRNGKFEPKIVPKNTRDVSRIEDKIQ